MSVLPARERIGEVHRVTRETDVAVRLRLDGGVAGENRTGVPFLDHMLDQVAQHGRMELRVIARGDVEIDDHHTVEDVGITLGQAIAQAVGDKTGIRRAGSFVMPMDEALVMASLDLSGRPFLGYALDVKGRRVGAFDCELALEFFRALAVNAQMTLHLNQLAGENAHHVLEAGFKAFARALDAATSLDPRVQGVPSTKGVL
ncbi:MAG TPA: imidazoleglycerol-phosphate dehydratase HisB [Armatimonadota bacterium]|nr:imidazoleglycerol-phosphate dehydratase HisB [Armatimonadota bacterium]